MPHFADYFNNLILNGILLRGDNKGKKGTSMLPTYSLSGMTIVTPAEIISNGRLKIEKNRIKSLLFHQRLTRTLWPLAVVGLPSVCLYSILLGRLASR